jgi:hypothetical protein
MAFITKRQQQALRCLQAGHLYSSAIQPGNWFSCNVQSGFFSTCTINTLIDAGWAGRGVLSEVERTYDGEEVIALTPEGRKLARLLCGSK